jgi:hypothetical protein
MEFGWGGGCEACKVEVVMAGSGSGFGWSIFFRDAVFVMLVVQLFGHGVVAGGMICRSVVWVGASASNVRRCACGRIFLVDDVQDV